MKQQNLYEYSKQLYYEEMNRIALLDAKLRNLFAFIAALFSLQIGFYNSFTIIDWKNCWTIVTLVVWLLAFLAVIFLSFIGLFSRNYSEPYQIDDVRNWKEDKLELIIDGFNDAIKSNKRTNNKKATCLLSAEITAFAFIIISIFNLIIYFYGKKENWF